MIYLKKIFAEPQYFLQQLKPLVFWKLNKITSLVSNYSFSLKHLWIMLTYSCNLSCKMCGQWGESGVWKKRTNTTRYLKLSDIRNFLNEVSKFKPLVLLTGGEPLLCKEWPEIAKYVKGKKLRCGISTNGTLLEKYRDEIVEFIDVLDVSIDGIKETHNEIRGADVFEDIISSMQAISEKKKKNRKTKPFIKISFTINDANFFKINETVEYLDNLNIEVESFIVRHLQSTSLYHILKHKEIFKEEFNIDTSSLDGFLYNRRKINLKILKEEIENIKNMKFKSIRQINFEPDIEQEEIDKFYENSAYIPKRFSRRCFASYLGVNIAPNGDIWICPDYTIGNVRGDNFSNIWNSKKTRVLRERIKKRGLFPACSICASLYVY